MKVYLFIHIIIDYEVRALVKHMKIIVTGGAGLSEAI